MKKEISLREILFVASMFFGMLFGAGNLIFPVSMGQKAGVEISGVLYHGGRAAPAFRCGNGNQ